MLQYRKSSIVYIQYTGCTNIVYLGWLLHQLVIMSKPICRYIFETRSFILVFFWFSVNSYNVRFILLYYLYLYTYFDVRHNFHISYRYCNVTIPGIQYRIYTIYWMYQYRAFTILEYQNRWSMHNTGSSSILHPTIL
jgi:hypothetical protein